MPLAAAPSILPKSGPLSPPSVTPLTMQIPQKPPIATYLYTVDRVWKLKSKKSKKIYSYALSYRDLEQIDPILNFPLPAEDLELVVLHSVKLWRIMNNDSHLKLFYSILPILFDFLLQNGFWEIFTFEHGCNFCS